MEEKKDLNDPINKMFSDKKRRMSKDFMPNIVEITHEESSVSLCDNVNISVKNCNASSFMLLVKLLEDEHEKESNNKDWHPVTDAYCDFIGKLTKEIKEKVNYI
jgi:hypothetical protein